jgi:hypothetical protein
MNVSGFGFITVEGRELAGEAATDRIRGAVERRVVVGDSVTYEDLTGSYPSPVSSTPTAFTLLAGSSNKSLPLAGPGQLLFVKLPDRVVLIDPDSQAVAKSVMAPASITGSAHAPTGSQAR